MSDAGGHSGRNADRSAWDPAASPVPPAITGLLKALVMAAIVVTTYMSAQHAGVLSAYVVVGAALVAICTHGRLLRWRGRTTPTRQPRGRRRYRRHPARMNRPPRPVSRRRDRADQEPFDTRLARFPLPPEFPGSARGTT
ncbi:hypothetical protein [Streptomyces sp. Root369]|uniref:hypothetical protein n=1 Tax=Streptomyces sp. Root369 TaxID=1736523 RepID=UPI00070F73A4|nr:hypothetical protein [Streptomyces sp. Root369]KQV93896.1 hypothetical protein ASD08_18030 [Streptomyces sp. Root369]